MSVSYNPKIVDIQHITRLAGYPFSRHISTTQVLLGYRATKPLKAWKLSMALTNRSICRPFRSMLMSVLGPEMEYWPL